MTAIIPNLPNHEYHAHPAISKSQLDLIARSPAHYQASLQSEHESTDALIFGSAFHDFVLQPELFAETYVYRPDDLNPRTKDGKAWLEAQADKIILKAEWHEQIQGMADSITAHSVASKLLTGGTAETSYFWTDADTGAECRCRPDYLHPSGIIVDLKSTTDASPTAFAKSCANFRYHVQAAFYSEGIYQTTGQRPKGFVFIAVEKTAPYAVGVYELDEAALMLGRELFQRDLDTYSTAKQNQQWYAYSPMIETLSLPAWAFHI
uniref:Exodeoxyribonuclease 8 n=1 Tax=Siphoviridae sp. ctbLB3 TaxID=2825565 RepID=A0A8S5PLL1_9CAUD|nr:MAG TPA: Exodeoxyribonuclease 8 [Siphoviridae sp. ctbLB3]